LRARSSGTFCSHGLRLQCLQAQEWPWVLAAVLQFNFGYTEKETGTEWRFICGGTRAYSRTSLSTKRRTRHPSHSDQDMTITEIQERIAQKTGDYTLIGDLKSIRPELPKHRY